ncbi:hypothetical protein GPN2_11480 [Streptomyces murinus]
MERGHAHNRPRARERARDPSSSECPDKALTVFRGQD